MTYPHSGWHVTGGDFPAGPIQRGFFFVFHFIHRTLTSSTCLIRPSYWTNLELQSQGNKATRWTRLRIIDICRMADPLAINCLRSADAASACDLPAIGFLDGVLKCPERLAFLNLKFHLMQFSKSTSGMLV